MESTNKKLKVFLTGELYSVKEIFSENHKLVIPDLQRDYCWGSNEDFASNKVSLFVDNLVRLYWNNPDDDINLGLFYGYEEEDVNPGSVMLCDGQQRLTTLFLLLGMLNRRCESSELEDCLMSEFERNDDHEPYLHYAIRENSLNFLSDLTWHFFLKQSEMKCVNDIDASANWYFHQYEVDPTIKSIKHALTTIEQYLANKAKNLDLREFALFIVTHIKMMYYDMGNRKNGEETFVVINTSGEPLSPVENLKPLMVNNADEALMWEDMEKWFWEKRKKTDTSDAGMREFLRCVYYLEGGRLVMNNENRDKILTADDFIFPYQEITLNDLLDYHKAYKRLGVEPREEKGNPDHYSWFLPSLRFALRFEEANVEDIKRFKETFVNLQKYKDKIKVRDFGLKATRIEGGIESPDFLRLLDLPELEDFDSENELRPKLQILSAAKLQSRELYNYIYNAFHEDEGHDVLYGQIKLLINRAGGAEAFDFEKYKCARKKFYLLFGKSTESQKIYISDVAIRFLLMQNLHHGLNDQRKLYDEGTYWRDKIIVDGKEQRLWDCLETINSAEDMKTKLQEFSKDEENKNNFYYPLIADSSWMEHSERKYFHLIGPSRPHMCVVVQHCNQTDKSDDWFLIGTTQLKSKDHGQDWSNFWYKQEFVYTINAKKHVRINIHADGETEKPFYAYIFNEPQPSVDNEITLSIAKEFGLTSPNADGFYLIGPFSAKESDGFVERIRTIMDYIDKI